MVTDRDDLVSALQAIVDGGEHPSVVRTATRPRPVALGYVFPGQGSQRPGMGRLFYESVPAFRARSGPVRGRIRSDFSVSPR